jgi:DNA-binding transcriptional MerR regulator
MYTPLESAARLGVAPVTLRKWAVEFRRWLSSSATQVSRGVARRYTDADLVVLALVHGYLARHFTYGEIRTFLQRQVPAKAAVLNPPSAHVGMHPADPAVAPHTWRSRGACRRPHIHCGARTIGSEEKEYTA